MSKMFFANGPKLDYQYTVRAKLTSQQGSKAWGWSDLVAALGICFTLKSRPDL